MIRTASALACVLLVTGCATRPKQYQAPDPAKMRAAETRLNTAVTKSRATAAKARTQVVSAREQAVHAAALVATAQAAIGVLQEQAPEHLKEAVRVVAETVTKSSDELRELVAKIDALIETQKQLEAELQESENARQNLANEQAAYIGEARKLADTATEEREYRIKAEKALSWYRVRWWGMWIIAGLGVLACVVVAFLKFSGRLALKSMLL